MNIMKQIQSLLERAKALHQQRLDENISEAEGDRLYNAAWALWEEAAQLIVDLTDSRVDHPTAMRIAIHRGDEVVDLLNRACI